MINKNTTIAALFVTCLFYTLSAKSDDGRAIAMKKDVLESGYKDYKVSIVMTLKNQRGETGVRKMSYLSYEGENSIDKSLVVFETPRDLNGLKTLTFSYDVKSDDQWIFIPSMRRVKRITTTNKSGPFLGSEFAYEDLSPQSPEKYSYVETLEEPCDLKICFVITRIPEYEYTGYTKEILRIDKDTYQTVSIDYYDKKSELLKTLTHKDYKIYLDKYWMPHSSEMYNHQTGKSTVIVRDVYQYHSGVREEDFSVAAIKRYSR